MSMDIPRKSRLTEIFQTVTLTSNGLHHDINELNKMFPSMLKKPTKALAKYADEVMRMACDDERAQEELIADFSIPKTKSEIKKANATTVGGLAYLAIHSKSMHMRILCEDRLNEMRKCFGYWNVK